MQLRRLFRFKTRTLLLAITISSFFFGWYENGLRLVRERSKAAQNISVNGGLACNSTLVSHDWMKVDVGTFDWLTDPFGDHLSCVEFGKDNGRKPVADKQFIDASPAIKKLAVPWLGLQYAKLTSLGYAAVADLTSLHGIDLSNSTITDSDLSYIAQLPDLRYLNIVGTTISDAGIKHLRTLSKLEELWIGNGHITSDAMNDLRELLPELKLNCMSTHE